MKNLRLFIPLFLVLVLSRPLFSGDNVSKLTIEKIMQDPKWIGSSPSRIHWSPDGSKIYFLWNQENAQSDSLYVINRNGSGLKKTDKYEREKMSSYYGSFDKKKERYVYEKNGDLFVCNLKNGKIKRFTRTKDRESRPFFSRNGEKIFFYKGTNLFSIDMKSFFIEQITDFKKGARPEKKDDLSWIGKECVKLSSVLKKRRERRLLRRKKSEAEEEKESIAVYTGKKRVVNVSLSPDEKYVLFCLVKRGGKSKNTIVPDFVTETGYTEDISSRPKVGSPQSDYELAVWNRESKKMTIFSKDKIPGIRKEQDSENKGKNAYRKVMITSPVWQKKGHLAIVNIFSQDHKDRWIMLLNPDSTRFTLIDYQHDDAWIGGPGIISLGGRGIGWMPDNRRVWFQSEETGYSHLYSVDIKTGEKRGLTSGKYEVYSPMISEDEKWWYFTANITHPGVRNFYRMGINGGTPERITFLEGRNNALLSPDEKMIAVRNSTSSHPWELYLMKNVHGAKPVKVTDSTTKEFNSYLWQKPKIITFKARDGKDVYARLYSPDKKEKGCPAVIFVHGAGYLQNAHKWWSSYFREYMFHNFLADRGYYVLDIDYRGSAGYGRDWRTAIYRDMGGKDLYDQIDGAKFLVDSCGVDAERIGIYGGSYGGFITLMAMFKTPGIFKAGAALRAVTDWAHYNNWYTSRILNFPQEDSLAYRRSSPIYYAEGLKGSLLMCHGMVDTNVHFQDIVRLTQRLIELGKDNWELAVYPMEGHGFREPSSWTDEYKRIFKLFEENLK